MVCGCQHNSGSLMLCFDRHPGGATPGTQLIGCVGTRLRTPFAKNCTPLVHLKVLCPRQFPKNVSSDRDAASSPNDASSSQPSAAVRASSSLIAVEKGPKDAASDWE